MMRSASVASSRSTLIWRRRQEFHQESDKGEEVMFKKIAIASATAALFGIGQGAWAGATGAQVLTVNASVATNCRVTTGPGTSTPSYDPTTPGGSPVVNFTPTIVFRCTKNTSTVAVSADLGAHNSSGQRRLALGAAAGGPFLNYQLYQPDTGAPG